MTGHKSVMLTFIRLGKTGKSTQLAQRMKQRLTPGKNFVGIALVPHIKNQTVSGCIKYTVDSNRQFYHAQIGCKMSTGMGNFLNQKRPKFPAELVHLACVKSFYILRITDLFQNQN